MLYCGIFLHFSLHALLEKRSPGFLHQQVGPLLNFILIFALILRNLSNVSLAFGPAESLFQCLLLVDDRLL